MVFLGELILKMKIFPWSIHHVILYLICLTACSVNINLVFSISKYDSVPSMTSSFACTFLGQITWPFRSRVAAGCISMELKEIKLLLVSTEFFFNIYQISILWVFPTLRCWRMIKIESPWISIAYSLIIFIGI